MGNNWADDERSIFDREDEVDETEVAPDDFVDNLETDEDLTGNISNPAELVVSREIDFGGRTFTIEEPDAATILAMLNWVGMLGVRANRFAGQSFKGLFIQEESNGKKAFVPPAETTIFAMLSVVSPSDLGRLSILAFFGGSKEADKAGREWLQTVPEKDIRIAPLVKALAYRIAQADDLREALKNLQVGAALGSLFQKK